MLKAGPKGARNQKAVVKKNSGEGAKGAGFILIGQPGGQRTKTDHATRKREKVRANKSHREKKAKGEGIPD